MGADAGNVVVHTKEGYLYVCSEGPTKADGAKAWETLRSDGNVDMVVGNDIMAGIPDHAPELSGLNCRPPNLAEITATQQVYQQALAKAQAAWMRVKAGLGAGLVLEDRRCGSDAPPSSTRFVLTVAGSRQDVYLDAIPQNVHVSTVSAGAVSVFNLTSGQVIAFGPGWPGRADVESRVQSHRDQQCARGKQLGNTCYTPSGSPRP